MTAVSRKFVFANIIFYYLLLNVFKKRYASYSFPKHFFLEVFLEICVFYIKKHGSDSKNNEGEEDISNKKVTVNNKRKKLPGTKKQLEKQPRPKRAKKRCFADRNSEISTELSKI